VPAAGRTPMTFPEKFEAHKEAFTDILLGFITADELDDFNSTSKYHEQLERLHSIQDWKPLIEFMQEIGYLSRKQSAEETLYSYMGYVAEHTPQEIKRDISEQI